jgi:hypothetical protein
MDAGSGRMDQEVKTKGGRLGRPRIFPGDVSMDRMAKDRTSRR